jgi:hypothetical protein
MDHRDPDPQHSFLLQDTKKACSPIPVDGVEKAGLGGLRVAAGPVRAARAAPQAGGPGRQGPARAAAQAGGPGRQGPARTPAGLTYQTLGLQLLAQVTHVQGREVGIRLMKTNVVVIRLFVFQVAGVVPLDVRPAAAVSVPQEARFGAVPARPFKSGADLLCMLTSGSLCCCSGMKGSQRAVPTLSVLVCGGVQAVFLNCNFVEP